MDDSLKMKSLKKRKQPLANRLVETTETDSTVASPQALIKSLKADINALKRERDFVHRYQAFFVAEEIDAILSTIEKQVLPVDVDAAVELLSDLVAITTPTFERVDDSDGQLGDVFYAAAALWGKHYSSTRFFCKEKAPEELFALYVKDDYGIYAAMVKAALPGLPKETIHHLMALFETRFHELNEYTARAALFMLADAKNSADETIRIAKTYTNNASIYAIDIATRLNNEKRSKEAIDWLKGFPSDRKNTYYDDYIKTLAHAYALENRQEEIKKLYWEAFLSRYNPHYLQAYVEQLSPKEHASAMKIAINHLTTYAPWNSVFHCLHTLNAYSELAAYILKHAESIHGQNYYLLRPIAKTLEKNGYPLAAIILYRSLAEAVIEKVQSKYYRYAVSDLKKAHTLAKTVENWGAILEESAYLTQLKAQHFRKVSLWRLYDEAF